MPASAVAISPLMLPTALQRALAQVAGLVAVAQLDRFVLAGRSAGGHRGAAHAAVGQTNIGFHGGIAARIQNLSSDDLYYFHEQGSFEELRNKSKPLS